jgi:hypothetical protein
MMKKGIGLYIKNHNLINKNDKNGKLHFQNYYQFQG